MAPETSRVLCVAPPPPGVYVLTTALIPVLEKEHDPRVVS